MGHKRNRGFTPRSTFEANKEKRGGRVLKIFRMVDRDQASLIGGGLLDLSRSGDIPDIKTSHGYSTFIFDPRLMPKGTNPAFLAGFEVGRITADVEHSDRLIDDGYSSAFGEPQLLGRNRKTLLLPLTAERLAVERAAVYGILGKHGVAGFSAEGKQRGYRPKPPTVAIGTFEQAVSKAAEGDVVEAISTVLDMQLMEYDQKIQLEELRVATYQDGR